MRYLKPILSILLLMGQSLWAQYTWLPSYDSTECLKARITPPTGFERIETTPGSFADWLQNLPLKPGQPSIVYYNGLIKPNQEANYAVIDIDIGESDLQQCADAVIRLRSEYFYAIGQFDSIAFNFTSGDRFRYSDWLAGKTPKVDGNHVSWEKRSQREATRKSFKEYLDILFTYAGSYSLSRELEPVETIDSMRVGDLFIEGGFPGHAMLIVDMALNRSTGEKLFLLAQSYMPAQNVHIVTNPNDKSLSPWYPINFGKLLYTLEWTFAKNELMRFR